MSIDTTIKTQGNELTFSTIPAGEGLSKALAMSRVDIIDMIRDSKLKGRGGAGFPTGIKWNFAAAEKRTPKYIMCNADEGEPGTFKDRLILSEYADLVMEGMTIGARAIGASLGLIYLRAEYAYLRKHLEDVVKERKAAGLLGQNIGGVEGFNFNIMVAMGAGAYVCGEETALIESLEGFRGEPRNRPPFPVVSGFLNRPSVVNNVETLAWVPCILAKGVDWFKSIGTSNSTGHKLFSVSGDCEKPGVYEFPFGITVAELLAEVGGGDAKAVQIGGASGRCVPKKDFERRLAFEDIPTGGSVIVIGPGRDMLEPRAQPDGLLRGRIVWAVHAMPRGQRQVARGRRDAQRGDLHRRIPGRAQGARQHHAGSLQVRPGSDQLGGAAFHPRAFWRRDPWPITPVCHAGERRSASSSNPTSRRNPARPRPSGRPSR